MINLQKVKNAIFSNLGTNVTFKKGAHQAQEVTKEITDGTLKTYSKCVTSAYAPKIKKDSDALNAIIEYGKKIRTKSEDKVSLIRNPLWDSDIPYQEKNYYRMIGEGGFKDIIENGLIRPKQISCGYDVSYFETGRANAIYAKKGGAKYILEIPENCAKIIKKEGAYPHMAPACAKDVPHRIWHMIDDGKYEIVSDTINDVISRHKDFKFCK